ncbi:UDP-3-O-(3-hydroxymyristoyl)glucosamine N-acyltransferase [Methylophaga sp.]|uniref:UDP-3-O-(3-hydroxymyristoyl)glucosamine N-acyltransferase n=1 Tax=Methylophaga sp. TaxID=2024840 RepID=UPI003F6A32E3
MSLTLAQIAEAIAGQLIGEADYLIDSVGTLVHAKSHQLSFLANKKYKKFLFDSQAGAVIVAPGMGKDLNTNVIEATDPYVAYAKAAALLYPAPKTESEIHPTAWVDPSAKLAENVSIGPHVTVESEAVIEAGVRIDAGSVIERNVLIGEGTHIKANVTVCHEVQIGQRALIHPGVVLGADGFGIANDNGVWIKVPQVGRVLIGNDVEIGANTTIDRGAIEDTVIGNGVKLDNQIQIAHNVIIGDHTVIAGCVGIAGSTRVGKYCAIGGGVAIGGHLEIADGVQLTGMSMVTKSISEAGVFSSGMPVEPNKNWHRNVVRYRQMDKLFERVKLLEKQIKD